MLYCARCRTPVDSSARHCPNCKNTKLRAAAPEDPVLLHRADAYAAGLLESRLLEAGISCQIEPVSQGYSGHLSDPTALPTDRNLYVPFGSLEAAQAISAQLKQELDAAPASEETEAERPGFRRLLLETVSVVVFLLLIMAAVFSADAVANWIRSLLGF